MSFVLYTQHTRKSFCFWSVDGVNSWNPKNFPPLFQLAFLKGKQNWRVLSFLMEKFLMNLTMNPRLFGHCRAERGQVRMLSTLFSYLSRRINFTTTREMKWFTEERTEATPAGGAACPASVLGGEGQKLALVPGGVRMRACRISDREIIPTMLSASFTTTSRWTCKQEKSRPSLNKNALKWKIGEKYLPDTLQWIHPTNHRR